ncbi:hypothetical protein CRE_07930 [Caenorhabditis remanei]|uniref:Uncharacterized protein n=1 Tax=Caenorhabditis remanei TaxID=31234 RepID=E3NR79_CAERE|nr:hypothetical protein CRE_07930 [Caenorhabditis remanei]
MNDRTRALNKQLFWTLGLQTLLPCFTQYMPVGLLFILPLFEIEVGKVGNIVGVTCCLYPAMDPLIAIFMIDRFRNCVFRKDNQSKTRSGRTWENGKRQFRVPDLLGGLLICNIIVSTFYLIASHNFITFQGLSFTTCIVCAYKTYKKLNDFSTQMSNRTRALNKQLFWTLGLQTLLPCFTQYMPVGLLFILPLFEIEVGKVGNIVGVTCCLYPAMDPLIAIFMID